MPGHFAITQDGFDRFRDDLSHEPFLPNRTMPLFTSAAVVSSGRFSAAANFHGHTGWMDLHTDGAGSMVLPLEPVSNGSDAMAVRDSEAVMLIVSALRLLAQHATDRAGASGTAVVSAQVLPDVLAFENSSKDDLHYEIRAQLVEHFRHDEGVVVPSAYSGPYNPQATVIPVTPSGAFAGRQ